MKKSLLLLVLFCGMFNCAIPCFADSRKTTINVVKLPKGVGSRTPDPSIYAYIEDGELTVSIDRYAGSVATTIDDSSDNTVMYDMQYMSGSTSYTIDVSAFSEDTYTIYFTFSDGREYYGTFTIQ